MYTKYYTITIPNTKKMQAKCKRKKILRTGIKIACGIVGSLAFIYMVGVAGGLEQDLLTIKEFWIHGAVAIGILALSIEVGNRI